jgi:membrane protease YdiL (CAAX protease family)
LCFSLYHVAPYAVLDPVNWIFLLQYIPASLLLARCYERCNSIWGSIFFHMLINAVSFSALSVLG